MAVQTAALPGGQMVPSSLRAPHRLCLGLRPGLSMPGTGRSCAVSRRAVPSGLPPGTTGSLPSWGVARLRQARLRVSAANGSEGSSPSSKRGKSDSSRRSNAQPCNDDVAFDMNQFSDIPELSGRPAKSSTAPKRGKIKPQDLWGEIAYNYYNWRSGTQNDIILFMAVVMSTLLGLAALQFLLLPGNGDCPGSGPWASVYYTLRLSFNDNFPDPGSGPQELYALLVAAVGLLTFTILLTMVEQLFLEVLETNVERGTAVYEEGHMLLLAWLDSELSLSAVWRILEQLCLRHRSSGGTVVVILCNKSKIQMEALFRQILPEDQRFGSTLVFRQGSPLVPDDLERVAAKDAAGTIVVSDASRDPKAADAQSMRAAVLLEDLHRGGTEPKRRGNIVVELKAGTTLTLLQGICSHYVIPLSTFYLNGNRLAQMVQRPITSYLTDSLLDFQSSAQHHFHCFPELAGTPYRELKYYFPEATAVAVMNVRQGWCKWQPYDHVLQEDDEIDFLRSGATPSEDFRPLPLPLRPDLSSDWGVQEDIGSTDERLSCLAMEGTPEKRQRDLDYPLALGGGEEILGEVVGVLEEAVKRLGEMPEELALQISASGSSGDIESELNNANVDVSCDLARGLDEAPASGLGSAELPAASRDGEAGSDGTHEADPELLQVPGCTPADELNDFEGIGSAEERRRQLEDTSNVLIIGASEDPLMCETIQAFDTGPSALAPGSKVTLFNEHCPAEQGVPISRIYPCPEPNNIRVSCLRGRPLHPRDLSVLPLERFTSIVIVCDKGWLDPDVDGTNGIDSRDPEDILRLDSMIMMVHVNVRMLLKARNAQNVRIVSEKVSVVDGKTRFDDPMRLPIGFVWNRKDYSARLLAHSASDQRLVPIILAATQSIFFEIRDPSLFVGPGEVMNYWALMERVADSEEQLLGYVAVPETENRALDLVINPTGEFRDQKIAWGNQQLKLITTSRRDAPASALVPRSEIQVAQMVARAVKRQREAVPPPKPVRMPASVGEMPSMGALPTDQNG
mmetsp:Transcript_13718/g.38824  ORF Transcript_13718/g.38824 Transcript_13718/m.38824 type:complete len:1022 (+) Transcript_13718:260-3325(+)